MLAGGTGGTGGLRALSSVLHGLIPETMKASSPRLNLDYPVVGGVVHQVVGSRFLPFVKSVEHQFADHLMHGSWTNLLVRIWLLLPCHFILTTSSCTQLMPAEA